MASARHSPRDREEIDLYKGVAGCEASARRCVGCLTWCLASAGWCVPCASSYGERHVDTTGCEDGGTGGDGTYLANIPPSTSWTYCRASQRGFPRRLSEKSEQSTKQANTFNPQGLAASDPPPTSRRLALTPLWLALPHRWPACVPAAAACPLTPATRVEQDASCLCLSSTLLRPRSRSSPSAWACSSPLTSS